MRDITLDITFYHRFTTRQFSDGVPTVLTGTPVLSVLEDNNATPITSGVSVSVDRASVVGLNEATIVATSGNGYENGKSYSIYISTGTVGGVSVVGEVVGEFTIGQSAAKVAIGTAGAGLTDLGGMSTSMQAEVESEANDALVALKLDHLIAVADGDDPVDGSIIAHMASKTEDWSTFVPSDDSLEKIADVVTPNSTTLNGMVNDVAALQAVSTGQIMASDVIASVTSQTVFVLTLSFLFTNDDCFNGGRVTFTTGFAGQISVRRVVDYVSSTKTVTIDSAPDFTIAAGNVVTIISDLAGKVADQTDQMVFSKANELDANTKSINDAEVVGDGNATPWDGV